MTRSRIGLVTLVLVAAIALAGPAWAQGREGERRPQSREDPKQESDAGRQDLNAGKKDPFSRDYRDVLEQKVAHAQNLAREARPKQRREYANLARAQKEALKAFDTYQMAFGDVAATTAQWKAMSAGPEKNQALLTKQEAERKAADLGNVYAIAGTKVAVGLDNLRRQAKQEINGLNGLRDAGAQALPIYSAPPAAIPLAGGRWVRASPSIADIRLLGQYALIGKQAKVGNSQSASSDHADGMERNPQGGTSSILIALDRAMAALPGLNNQRVYDAVPPVGASASAGSGAAGQGQLPPAIVIPLDSKEFVFPSRLAISPGVTPPFQLPVGLANRPPPIIGLPPPPAPYFAPPAEGYITLERVGSTGSSFSTDTDTISRQSQPLAQIGQYGQPALNVSDLAAAIRNAKP